MNLYRAKPIPKGLTPYHTHHQLSYPTPVDEMLSASKHHKLILLNEIHHGAPSHHLLVPEIGSADILVGDDTERRYAQVLESERCPAGPVGTFSPAPLPNQSGSTGHRQVCSSANCDQVALGHEPCLGAGVYHACWGLG
ncbi:hypothetical protein RRG08_015434 [Elysia crispata]|uniref:Uncharacterized protein n=1 Tax=Elysia crispata TaxID=231223 RepID=A0AAE0YHC6_9GAST|nr:hypothetical protein RRG08_015434 [Elysia crispata]